MRNSFLVTIILMSLGLISPAMAQEEYLFDEYKDNPVFKYSDINGSFDQNRVFSHDIIKVDGLYKMFYSGLGNGNSVQIGLATSLDGIVWYRAPESPVFKCAENTGFCSTGGVWSHFRVSVVSVEYKDSKYTMWYQGDNQNLYSTKKLGVATSLDGIHWTPNLSNPVFVAEDRNGIRYISVLPIASGYRLYFSDGVDKGFYYVDSVDGINWSAIPQKIGDERVHTVAKIDDKFIAVADTRVATSSDGLVFNFSKSAVTIANNSGPDEARVEFISEGDIVRSWRVHYLGNVSWNYGNFAIHYATTSMGKLFGLSTEVENKYPLYTQIESPFPSVEETSGWENDKYAGGIEGWCGDTIGGCGCAITSGVMAGRGSGITTDVLGQDVNPKNMDDYLTSIGGYTTNGSVYWLAMQSYLGEFTDEGKLSSRFKYEGMYGGDSTMSAIDGFLSSSKTYALLAYKDRLGHFVWLPEKTATSYVVRDPLWYLTNTANDTTGEHTKDYDNSFDSVKVFEVLDEPEIYSDAKVESYVRGTAQLLYRDAMGKRVGFADGEIVVDIERSSYGSEEVIGQAGVPSSTSGGNHLLVYAAQPQFSIEIVGTAVGEYEVELFAITEDGKIETFTFSGLTFPGVTTTFNFDLETGKVIEQMITYDQFLLIMKSVLGNLTLQQKAFFEKWAEKMYADMEEKTVTQALQTIETFGKLLVARKVGSPALLTVLEKLSLQVKE